MAIEESATSDDQWADADDNGFGDSGSDVAVETQAPPDTETTTPDVEETPSDDGESDADGSVEGGAPAKPQAKPQGEVQAGDAEQTTQPKFPADLLKSLGLSEQQAQQRFGTPEQLETAVRLQDQLMVNAGRQAMQPQGSRQQPPPQDRQAAPPVQQDQAAQQAAQAAQVQQQQKAATGFEPFQFDPNEWDPATAKLLQGMNDHYAKQIQSLAGLSQPMQQMESALNGLLNVQLQQAQASYVQEFESEINSLGDEWKDLLGKGSGMAMDRESPQIQNRIKLDESMLMLARGRRESGLPPLTQKELFERALRLEFPNKTTAIAQKQVISKATTRAKQFTQRPTGRNGKPLSGDEAASNRVESFFQDRGFTQDADEDLGDALI